jgi:hypothetical protein
VEIAAGVCANFQRFNTLVLFALFVCNAGCTARIFLCAIIFRRPDNFQQGFFYWRRKAKRLIP